MFADWREMPAGYYADPEVKTRHDRRGIQEERFNFLVDEEIRRMGYDPETVLDTDVIQTAEENARRRLE